MQSSVCLHKIVLFIKEKKTSNPVDKKKNNKKKLYFPCNYLFCYPFHAVVDHFSCQNFQLF